MLESITATIALLKPAFTEAPTLLPARSSSLILSKITTSASTAIPIERITPAIPGSVSVTGQRDRGAHNFLFECNSDGVLLAPLCDNGWVFSYEYNYDSPFGNYCLFETDMFTTNRKSMIDILKSEKTLYERFGNLLDVDVKEVLKRTLDKYMIVLDIGSRGRILRYMDNKKKAIDATLKLSRKK